jgi:GxxExxY protein
MGNFDNNDNIDAAPDKDSIKEENKISFAIRGAVFKVYNTLGPGLLESVYEAALAHELRKLGMEVKTEVDFPVNYDTIQLELGFRLDMIVNDLVIVEIKSVETLAKIHYKQLLTYLRLTDKKLGLLINFNESNLINAIKRVANGL